MWYTGETSPEVVYKSKKIDEMMSPFACGAFGLLAKKLRETIDEIAQRDEEVRKDLNTMMKEIMDYVNNECRGKRLNEVLKMVDDFDDALGGLAERIKDDEELRKLVNTARSLLSRMREVVEREIDIEITPTAPYPSYLILPRSRWRRAVSLEKPKERKHELTETERRVRDKLVELGRPVTLSELSKELGMDRSNLLKRLKILVLADEVEKRYENGRIVYSAKQK